MTKRNFVSTTILTMVLLSMLSYGAEISGLFFPEYYMVSQHNEDIEGQHGFRFRRIQFGYQTELGKGWSLGLRLEMNSKAFNEDKLTPYVKNAYVKKKLWEGAHVLVGIMNTPSFNKIEKFWGYRYIEKTTPDFFKLASSRDFGIALDGTSKGGLVYTIMVGNYSSHKSEKNKGKAFYGRIGWQSKHLYLEANGHVAGDGDEDDNRKDIIYLTFFGGFKSSWGRIGAGYHYYYYKEDSDIPPNDYYNGIISAFAVVKLHENLHCFVRYDHSIDKILTDIDGYIPISKIDNSFYTPRFVVTGIDYQINDWIRLSPNVKVVFYEEANRNSDLYFNLSGLITFKTKIGSSK